MAALKSLDNFLNHSMGFIYQGRRSMGFFDFVYANINYFEKENLPKEDWPRFEWLGERFNRDLPLAKEYFDDFRLLFLDVAFTKHSDELNRQDKVHYGGSEHVCRPLKKVDIVKLWDSFRKGYVATAAELFMFLDKKFEDWDEFSRDPACEYNPHSKGLAAIFLEARQITERRIEEAQSRLDKFLFS